MKRHIYIVMAGVGLLGSSLSSTYAQGTNPVADTLRRSLNVMTTDHSSFSARMPQTLSPLSPQVRYAAQGGAVAPQLTMPLDGLLPKVAPLETVTPLPQLFAKRADRGYISADFGLKYNARLMAGLRAINTQSELLDFSLSGLWSRYNYHDNELSLPLREWGVGLGTHWAKTNVRSTLDLKASLRHGSHNLYGTSGMRPFVGLAPVVDQSALDRRTTSREAYTLAKAELSLRSVADPDAVWLYRITPSLSYANKANFSEFSAKSAFDLARSIGGSQQVGIDFTPHILLYSSDQDAAPNNSVSFDLSPTWRMQGAGQQSAWSVRAGLGLSSLSRSFSSQLGAVAYSEQLWAVYPVLHGRIFSTEHHWELEANVGGGSRANTLSNLLEESPQLGLSLLAPSGMTRFSSDLKGAISPIANLSLGLRALYEVIDGNANPLVWVYDGIDVGQVGRVSYAYRAVENKHFSIGANVVYEAQSLFRLAARLDYHSWSSPQLAKVSGQPALTFGADLSLEPLSKLKLRLGYELLHGIKYEYHVGADRPNLSSILQLGVGGEYLSLPSLHYLTAAMTYGLSERWSIQANGHVSLNAQAQRYLGYPMQHVSINLGASYRF